jgi:serine/threonine protein kinase
MAEMPAATDAPPPAPPEWPVVPGYEILGELGRGGMGVVYRARQLQPPRTIALKVIRDGALAGPQLRARFRIEAEAAARVRHPNVVAIHAVGEHQGRPFFAMELIEGPTLEKHLASQPLSVPEAAALLRTLARAVQHAHEQGIVHRDLKPANVLLAGSREQAAGSGEPEAAGGEGGGSTQFPVPSSQFPKIADFGLAKRLDADTTAVTLEGAVLGTAGYMAPEQADGRASEAGPPADVYALGAILYECLTGQPPFPADSWRRTFERILHDEPAPPSRLSPEVPAGLDAVCLKCLEKEPGARYGSAGDLADDLGRFLDGQSVNAAPPDPARRLARLAARDGYQLAGEIGSGPRSTVYRARQGALPQPVAVKVYRTGNCTRAEWDAWLGRDAGAWAALAHPHLVAVQGAGWWDGAPYLAMEYVPLGSLAARLATQRYTVREALRLVEQLADVVGYLHRQGVVHGNLKPSNVLFAADGIPRISDCRSTATLFRQSLPADGPADSGLGYLAPESASDQAGALRPNADVYGLGAILYALLTGRPPFAGATVGEVIQQVRAQDPEPPSRFNPQVTAPLEAVCLRCLRKNPWRRYSRTHDLILRLQYFQDHPDGSGGPIWQLPRRRPPA